MPPVDPPQPVLVLDDGGWFEGYLEYWRRDGDRWRGFVRYSRGLCMNYLAWFDQELLKPATDMPSQPVVAEHEFNPEVLIDPTARPMTGSL